MAVFKVTYTGKDGKPRQSGNYYVEFRDHNDVVRRVPGFKGKRESEKLQERLQSLVATRSNDDLPKGDLKRWLDNLDNKQRNRLVKFKLVDERHQQVGRALADHLADFKAKKLEMKVSDKQAQLVYYRARRVFEEAGFQRLSDITRDGVESAAARLRERENMSAQTFNFHLAACKQFTSWCVEYDRMQADPLAVKLKRLGGMNVAADRRHVRRALSAEEVRNLLEAAQTGPERYGVTGPDRALLYRVALETGLRSKELRTLTVAKLDLTGKHPSLTVAANLSKNRTEAEQPLRPATAAILKAHCKDKLPSARVFTMPETWNVAAMLRADLDAAGIPYRDDNGEVADFHALRHTFVTNLAEGGVHPKIAQKLARHSSITLTMDRYTHLRRDDERAALDALPDVDAKRSRKRRG